MMTMMMMMTVEKLDSCLLLHSQGEKESFNYKYFIYGHTKYFYKCKKLFNYSNIIISKTKITGLSDD